MPKIKKISCFGTVDGTKEFVMLRYEASIIKAAGLHNNLENADRFFSAIQRIRMTN